MSHQALESEINELWDKRDTLDPHDPEPRWSVAAAIGQLDRGESRVAEPDGEGGWRVNEWLKRAVLLSFRLDPMEEISHGPGGAMWWDRVPSKFAGWDANDFRDAGFRAVPGSLVRRGAYIGRQCVLMPSFVNIGAYVGEGTMVDTWVTIGSCAQIGARCHISGGVGIGGVLEPLQARPTIIEDDVFIGARSEVAEGVIVREGAVLAMGVFLSASTKIVDRESGAIGYGEAPARAVIVPGVLPDPKGGPSLSCAVIVKRRDSKTDAKTALNALLRD